MGWRRGRYCPGRWSTAGADAHVQRWFERVVFAGVVPPPLVVGEAIELRYALVIAVEQVVVQLVDVLQFVLRGGRELGFGMLVYESFILDTAVCRISSSSL